MFLRALVAFLILPGVFAFALPAYFAFGNASPSGWQLMGFLPFAIGFLGLLTCVREFYVAGKGTLAPWSPPKHLVRTGFYLYSRNPMYLSVLAILVGWSTSFSEPALWAYTVLAGCAFHFRVVFGEEPWLERTFGEDWRNYKYEVPRWLGVRPHVKYDGEI